MVNLTCLYVKLKLWSSSLYEATDIKFKEQFGFRIKEVTLGRMLAYLYAPKDSSSLAVTRILFGIAMLFDIPDERGGAIIDKRWGDPMGCHFPLVPFIRAVPLPYMAFVYTALWLGALGIALGYRYRISAWLFTVCYWYLLLIEKSFWNNHSYLFGLVALLLACTEANCYWSLDVYLGYSKSKQTVPYWNYFILKYQFFILYFMAGMKKGTAEWLTGYSVQNLSEHWVFNPFKLFLSTEQTDYLIVHWFVFVFDLTVAIWMMWSKTRHVAMIFCALFHLMNSRLFRIGMFPWVCLATMPLFYPFDWPKIITSYATKQVSKVKGGIRNHVHNSKNNHCSTSDALQDMEISDEKCNEWPGFDEDNEKTDENDVIGEEIKTKNNSDDKENDLEQKSNSDCSEFEREKISEHEENWEDRRKNVTFLLIVLHVLSQVFLPYSHFITKGYNNWTNGLYGYSWDMMVHTWDLESVVVKVVDNTNQEEFYVDPYIYTPNDRWTRHGDMVYQYAKCLKANLIEHLGTSNRYFNISIYIDVWCSMNGRFTQRIFDSKVDLLNATWSPFQSVSYLMPLLDEALGWRTVLQNIRTDVHTWSNYSDVIFVADFAGYDQEKYIPPELTNISMRVLDGNVAYQPEVSKFLNAQSYRLTKGNQIKIDPGAFHKVINIGETSAFYMYTFANNSQAFEVSPPKPKLPIGQELFQRLVNMVKFANIVGTNIFSVF
ncbi:vitamin K-dependent gamma-carboxylase [Maniola hyperantus]|uniref:vitamin K-dependent gamma-carboxylase n=1 Tax=Aphantopus hyperantus TaxID=2795564 RepID=UPI001567F3B7|nr:vitamin K-dependent gamma-carboxylase [Maniola hyperantus]